MSYHVLVADDSGVARAVLKKVLAMIGLEVARLHEAADGGEALEVLRRERVDVVLTDLNMPVVSGPELIRRMRADPALAGKPVVVVSSEQGQLRREQLRRAGVRAYVTKPYRPERLREVLAEVLGAPGGHRAG